MIPREKLQSGYEIVFKCPRCEHKLLIDTKFLHDIEFSKRYTTCNLCGHKFNLLREHMRLYRQKNDN